MVPVPESGSQAASGSPVLPLFCADTSALDPSTPLPWFLWPRPHPSSHLRRQHRDVVELEAESRSEAELLGLPFPSNKQQDRWVRAEGWVLASNSLGFAIYHVLTLGNLYYLSEPLLTNLQNGNSCHFLSS